MPFRSAKQRRYLWANEPEIARRWTKEHGSRIQKDNGGIMRLPFQGGGNYLQNTAAQNMFGKMYHTLNPFEKFQINQAIDTYGPNEPGITAPTAKRIGVLEDLPGSPSLDDFMNERLEERIEKEKRKIEEQLGIGGMGLPSLPKEPFYKEADPGQPVWDMDTNKYYDPITGREVPNPNIPQKRNMDTMPYIKEPFSPIGQFASLTGDNKYISVEEARKMARERSIPDFVKGQISNYPHYRSIDPSTIPQRWMRGLRNVGGNIRQGINRFMGNRFQYKPAVASAGGYSAAQLNQLNARGGYYSSPARQQRQDRARVADLLARKAADKPYSQANLNQLTMGSRPGHYDPPGGDRSVRGTSSPSKPGGWHPGVARGGRIGRNEGGLASIWPR